MALGAMTVVAVSILTATTLLPALIAMLGDRVMRAAASSPRAASSAVAQARRRLPAGPSGPAVRADPAFWAALDWRASWPSPGARGDRGQRAPAHPRDPAALDRHRHRGARPVPKGNDVRVGNELASQAARRRRRPGADRRPFDGGARDRAAVAAFDRGSRATPGVARSAPPAFAAESVLIQATPERAQRVRRRDGAGRPAARHGRPGLGAEPSGDGRRRRRDRPQPRRPRLRSAARCGRSSSSCWRSASSS